MIIKEVFNGKCRVIANNETFAIEAITVSEHILDKLSSYITKQPRGKDEQEIVLDFVSIEKDAIDSFSLNIEWELEGRIRNNGEDYLGKIKFITIKNKYKITSPIDENGYIGIKLTDTLLHRNGLSVVLDENNEWMDKHNTW